jgi:DWNN domain
MNSVWYKFRSATTWRELQIPSTFITIGEMRQLICKELHLQEQETVLMSENGDENYNPLADEKQYPRGSRFWARRTTFEHLLREKEEQARRANEAKTEDATPVAQEDSDDDFGPDLFDRDAQLKYEERERLEAIADQHKLEQEVKVQQKAGNISVFFFCNLNPPHQLKNFSTCTPA